MTAPGPHGDGTDALADAVYDVRIDLLGFLLGALETPSKRFVEGLLAGEATLGSIDVNEPLEAGFERLEAFADRASDRSIDAVYEDIAAEHARLLEGSEAPVATREAAYRDGADGDVSNDVEANYEDAGWTPPDGDTASDSIVV